MTMPQRSVRLLKRSARSLDVLSGSPGEIFFDESNGTLRVYTGTAGEKIIIATRGWVTTALGDQAAGGINYGNLQGAPTALSAFTNDVGFITSAGGITSDDLVWEVYDTEADLPSASDNHGMFAHVHGTGKAYYAHAGAWIALATKTELDNLDVSGGNTTYVLSESSGTLSLTSSAGVVNNVQIFTAAGGALTGNLTFATDLKATFGDTNQLQIETDTTNGPQITSSSTLKITPTTSLQVSTADIALATTGDLILNSQTWPAADGTGGYYLTTNGSGALAWASAYAGLSVTTSAAGANALSIDTATGILTFVPQDLSSLGFSAGVTVSEFSSDVNLTGNSDTAVPTEKAVKTYVDAAVLAGSGAANVYNTVTSDDGTATATGSTDTLGVLGGTHIATAIATDSDNVTINMSAFTIDFLSDVDTSSSAPTTGQVLKWNGSNWAPGTDATTGGSGTDADTLDGFDGSYYLDYANLSGTPSVLTLGSLSVGNELTAAGDGAISYDNTSGVFRYTPPDLTTYLTSYTETNDLSSAVTWANVPDTNITQSSVTQHQTSLSVTESQISDLQTYLTSYTVTASDLSTLSVGAFSDVNLGTPTAGQILAWNAVSNKFDITTAPYGNTYVNADVDTHLNITAAGTNQILSWDGADYQWVDDATGAAGGGDPDQNLWATITGDTGTTTANTTTDSLTVAGGTNITTSVEGDIVTVAFSGTIPTDVSDLTDDSNLISSVTTYPAITQLRVTNSGSSAYLFNNHYSGNNPTVYAISGTTIAFDIQAGGHPFQIQTAANVAYNTGLIHVSTTGTITTGVSAQGKDSGILYWQIPIGTTGNYEYQCTLHGGMVGTIVIKDFATL
jgi:plastocyanin|tara:strand:- start:1091 stop:3640 length:2550 start_codon:yes stop_codon:yes gene_type:complete